MISSIAVLALVTLQRLGELVLANRNTGRLRAMGAIEVDAGHYPVIVTLHGAWLLGLWILAWDRPIDVRWLLVFLALQLCRVWVIASLGRRWTTRIILLPGEPLVRRGPYRFLSHPNYLVVVGEIAVLPIAFHLWWFAALLTVMNASVLYVRIRSEAAALKTAGVLGRSDDLAI